MKGILKKSCVLCCKAVRSDFVSAPSGCFCCGCWAEPPGSLGSVLSKSPCIPHVEQPGIQKELVSPSLSQQQELCWAGGAERAPATSMALCQRCFCNSWSLSSRTAAPTVTSPVYFSSPHSGQLGKWALRNIWGTQFLGGALGLWWALVKWGDGTRHGSLQPCLAALLDEGKD